MSKYAVLVMIDRPKLMTRIVYGDTEPESHEKYSDEIPRFDEVDELKAWLLFNEQFEWNYNWVTVYEVCRYYGGPEEGGWWDNQQHAVCYIPVGRSEPAIERELQEVENFLKRRFVARGNIYSVTGGVDYVVERENELGENTVNRHGYE